MRFLLKLLAAPAVLSLSVFVWLCMRVLYLSGFVLGLISTIVGLPGETTWQFPILLSY